MSNPVTEFNTLDEIATHLRGRLKEKKYVLLFAYNGTGKTRLSMSFKEQGKQESDRDTLYFNAFTEDLFSWDNDIENDTDRKLKLNHDSRFFKDLDGLDIENNIRPMLHKYADFNFFIDYDAWQIIFFRESDENEDPIPIKVSRGEENTFIWCFFLAIAQYAMDATEEGEPYEWVNKLYIDDPISSLDDNNAIAVASELAQMLKKQNRLDVVISSHHTLFFNIISNELGNAEKLFLSKDVSQLYHLERIDKDSSRFYHVALLKELKRASDSGEVYMYHFNQLRTLLEKTAAFHGFTDILECIKSNTNKLSDTTYKRIINARNHGGYTLFEPEPMTEEDKECFKSVLCTFMGNYRFNPKLFPELIEETTA